MKKPIEFPNQPYEIDVIYRRKIGGQRNDFKLTIGPFTGQETDPSPQVIKDHIKDLVRTHRATSIASQKIILLPNSPIKR